MPTPQLINPAKLVHMTKIPANAIIATSKPTDYLLLPRPSDDKSKFLGQAGFHRDSPKLLESAIRQLAANTAAVDDGMNEYGMFWRVDEALLGPNGVTLDVAAIWLERRVDGSFHFVTLKPRRNQS
jgi:uncharacterized protein DUF6883